MKLKKGIILVHGTFASTKTGWASLENGFLAKIHKALYNLTGQLYFIYSFEWSGSNSLYARQSASVRLMQMLKELSESHSSLHLIGHSHGGTIIQYALENHSYLNKKNTWKDKVKSWTTVGTPFYKFKGIKKRISAKSLYTASSTITILFFGITCYFLANKTILDYLQYIQSNYLLLIFSFFIGAGLLYQFLEAITFNSNLELTFENFGNKWLGIYSRYDEAIIGLKNSRKIKMNLSKREFPSDGVSIILLFLTRLISNIVYDYTFRIIISKFLTSRFKNFATGIDRSYFKIKSIDFTPTVKQLFFIPNELDNQMLKEVIKDNKDKIGYIREMINSENKNLLSSLIESEDDDKPKLIHSMYFEQNEIIKFILEHILINENVQVNLTEWMKEFRKYNSR